MQVLIYSKHSSVPEHQIEIFWHLHLNIMSTLRMKLLISLKVLLVNHQVVVNRPLKHKIRLYKLITISLLKFKTLKLDFFFLKLLVLIEITVFIYNILLIMFWDKVVFLLLEKLWDKNYGILKLVIILWLFIEMILQFMPINVMLLLLMNLVMILHVISISFKVILILCQILELILLLLVSLSLIMLLQMVNL